MHIYTNNRYVNAISGKFRKFCIALHEFHVATGSLKSFRAICMGAATNKIALIIIAIYRLSIDLAVACFSSAVFSKHIYFFFLFLLDNSGENRLVSINLQSMHHISVELIFRYSNFYINVIKLNLKCDAIGLVKITIYFLYL